MFGIAMHLDDPRTLRSVDRDIKVEGNGEDKLFQAWADLPPAEGAVYIQ
jgi:hypothetical protein